MIPYDAAMLALAAGSLVQRARLRLLAGLAPLAVLAAALPSGLPSIGGELLLLAPLVLAALVLRTSAAPAFLLCIPDYPDATSAFLTAGIWIGGTLLLDPVFARCDRSKLPSALAGAPIRLLCCGGMAIALHPLQYI